MISRATGLVGRPSGGDRLAHGRQRVIDPAQVFVLLGQIVAQLGPVEYSPARRRLASPIAFSTRPRTLRRRAAGWPGRPIGRLGGVDRLGDRGQHRPIMPYLDAYARPWLPCL
jgi:hypothetical protein